MTAAGIGRGLPLAFLLILATALAAWSGTPPAAVGGNAPATAFSATRAMATVRLVSQAPHPIGSPQAAAVRAGLTARLRAMGLVVRPLAGVGAAVSVRGRGGSARAGRIETLVATLPGADPALPAMAIMAHTDSVPDSFGAADDGAGLAVALETARAVAAGPKPVRDVLLILTDGEEAGLLGARAFFAEPGRAARVGAIVNIDARGTSGLGAMFETGPGSGGLVTLYRARATHRFAHSAATFLYRRLPNSTDLTAAAGHDVPALNFAFLDGEFDYHTPRDRPASLDPRTLQSLGDQVLPVVRAVADRAALPPRGEDGVFGDAPAIVAIRYPAWVGWPLLALAAALAGWGVRGASPGGSARAAAAMAWAGLAAALLAGIGYGLTGVGGDWGEHHRIMARFGRYEAALGLAALACVLAAGAALRGGGMRRLLALACLAGGLVAVLLGRAPGATAIVAAGAALLAAVAFAGPSRGREMRAGALGLGLVVAVFLQLAAPPLTPLVLWPTLAAAIMAAVARARPEDRWIGAAVALPPLAYTLAFGHAVLLALGVPTPEAVALFATVGFLLVAPLVGRAGWPAGGAAIVAGVLLLSFRWAPATERHPILSQLWGIVDADGRNWRVSALERPGGWTRAALGGGGAIGRATMPVVDADPLWRAPARTATLPHPTIALARDGAATTLTVTPASGGRELRLLLRIDRPLAAASVAGVALPRFAAAAGEWRLRWHSAGEPVTLRFRASPGTRLTVEAAEVTEHRLALPPRPADVAPWLGSDRIIVLARAGWRL